MATPASVSRGCSRTVLAASRSELATQRKDEGVAHSDTAAAVGRRRRRRRGVTVALHADPAKVATLELVVSAREAEQRIQTAWPTIPNAGWKRGWVGEERKKRPSRRG